MRHQTFQDVAIRYAQVMGRKDQIEITFGGDMAYTNGKRINLPAMPAGTTMTPHQARVMGGYLDHETAHIRYSDFTEFKHLDGTKEDADLKHFLWNVFEDIRIENKQIQNYGGSRSYLDALCYEVDQRSRAERMDAAVKGQPEDWAARILSLIYKEAYAKYRDIDTHTIDGWLSDYPELLPIANAMKKLQDCKSTKQTGKLADEVMNALPKNLNYGGVSDTVKNFIKEILMGPPTQGDQPSQQIPGVAPMAGQQIQGQGQQGPSPLTMINPTNQQIAEALHALVAAAAKEWKAKDKAGIYTELIDDIQAKADQEIDGIVQHSHKKRSKINPGNYTKANWQGTEVLPPVGTENDHIFVPSDEDMATYTRERNNMRAEILATRKMLNIFLQSRRKKTWTKGLEEGVLDNDMLFSDQDRIYKERRVAAAMNTAMLLMLDLSGSMTASLVRQMAIILAEATFGVKFLKVLIAGFVTNNKCVTHSDPRNGGRMDGIDIELFKDFEEPYNHCKGRLGAIATGNYTPLGDGYAYAYEKLLKREEEKKVLCLISDGEPYISIKDTRHSETLYMKQVNERCKKHRIQTIGMGVGSRGSIEKYTQRFLYVENCHQMPLAVLNMVRGVVLKQAEEVK